MPALRSSGNRILHGLPLESLAIGHLPWATSPENAEMTATTPTNMENDLGYAEKAAGPCVFVLFGAAGDLTKRKLVPALFNLVKAKLLPTILP